MKYKTSLLDTILALLRQIYSKSSSKLISRDFVIRHCSNFDKDIVIAHLNLLNDQGLIKSSTGYGNNSDAFKITSEGILKLDNGGFSKEAKEQNEKSSKEENLFLLQIKNLEGQIDDINKRRSFYKWSAYAAIIAIIMSVITLLNQIFKFF